MGNKNIFYIFLFSIFYFLFSFFNGEARAEGASLYFSAQGDSFGVGETFFADIKMDTEGIPINAARVHINFQADKLKVINISKDDSIFSLWPDEPAFSNDAGEVYFSGGLPHPGFNGNNGQILRIQFEAEKEGEARLKFGDSQILANDGKGTDIFYQGREENYIIKPPVPQVLSSTHPDPNRWHKENNLRIYWNINQTIAKVSFVLDKNPQTWPDEIPEGRVDSYEYKNLADGVWFFHLRVNTEKGWSNPRHFQTLIDKTSPGPFDIVVDNQGDPTNPRPALFFRADDSVSGVDHYVVKIGEGPDVFIETVPANPFLVPLQKPGIHQVVVEAVDRAENSRESATKIDIKPIQKPLITVWPQKFISGAESFYLAGTALPNVEVIIFLGKNSQTLKEWRVRSDEKGEWSFASDDILKSGFYRLSIMAKDERGAVSELSEGKNIESDFSGIELGPIMLSFVNLAIFLFIIFILGLNFMGFGVYKTVQLKKSLRKEAREARETLYQAFADLKKELERRVEMFDSQPGFTKQEKMIYDDLLRAVKTAQESIDKEIIDIANCLK